jgi:sugar lactone lactonase YvrE
MLNLISAKLTGTPSESGWSQVHEFTPEDDKKLKLRGHLFALVSTSRGEAGIDAVTSGRELISRLHEEYFGNLEAKPFNALQSATQKVTAEFRTEYGEIEIASCAVVEGVVYSSAGGGAKVLICRDGSLATLLDSEGEVITASGFPKNGDVMMLGTRSFFAKISIGVIRAALQSSSPESAAEVFAPTIHAESNQGGLGTVIIKFEEKSVFVPEIATRAPTSFTIAKVKTMAGGIFSKIMSKLPERRIYIKSGMTDEVVSQSKKLSFTIAVALLVILAVSIGFGIRQKRINDVRSKYQGILQEAQLEVDEAISLSSVSPDRSRELFGSSIQKLEQIKALNVKDPKVEELEKKINDSRESILGEYLVPSELFLDLSLLSSGFKGDLISSSGGNIFILDKNGKRIVSVQIENKKSKVVAGPGVIDEALDLASYEDRAFVLSSDGIYEVDTDKTKVVEKSWEGEAFIKAFAANLYVLDKAGGAIYRYAGSGNTFGDKQNWLSVGTNPDFSDAKSWVIDGSVYVLYPNSRVLKFSLGSGQNFSIKGVIPEIGTVDAVYADADSEDLYFLDRAGKRVVVTDKKGIYIAQYVDEQIGNATNLAVSEADKKILLLTGDKLYSIELKNP